MASRGQGIRKSVHSAEQKIFRELMIEARKAAGLTQHDVAKHLKRPQSFVAKYEGGERRIDVVEFLQIAQSSAAMIAFGAETILGKQGLLRAAFDDVAHVNISQLMCSQFRQYCDGRRIDPMALRFPRLPAPGPGTPRHHWAHTIEPAVRRLPPRSRKDLRTCAFGYFFGFAWYDELPDTPEWIVPLLIPQDEAGPTDPPNVQPIPHLPPV
jgi:transcriptional regulator with XRE-family HTH domain